MRPGVVGLSAAAIAAALLLTGVWAAAACANGGDSLYDLENLQPGERAIVKLPCEFDVLPGNRLYLYGVRVHHVVLALAQGDSLCLNGVPLLPRRAVNEREAANPHDRRDWQFLAAVPYVAELVSRGVALETAGPSYLEEQLKVCGEVKKAYAGYRRDGAAADEAARQALDRLRDIDALGLIDWTKDVRVEDGIMCLWWRGQPAELSFRLEDEKPVSRTTSPGQIEKRTLSTHLYEMLGLSPGPCWHFITLGADVTACGARNVAIVQGQLSAARGASVVPEGPLSSDAVLSVLRHEE
jgi:hypothetical protein